MCHISASPLHIPPAASRMRRFLFIPLTLLFTLTSAAAKEGGPSAGPFLFQKSPVARPPSRPPRARGSISRATYIVGDPVSFSQAIAAINNEEYGGQYTIILNGSFTGTPVAFTGKVEKTIIIKGDDAVRVISNKGGSPLFTVPRNITLILDGNVTLNGDGKGYRVVFVKGGSFVMKSVSMVRDSRGGGVYVEGGSFTMEGGEIRGNSASNNGGGVYIGGKGSFRMSGGTINENTAASPGGGVYVGGNSAFIMSGGIIGGNTASSKGGGVYVGGNSAFTMSGGSINGNSVSNNGGGVYIDRNGTFTMNGGVISRNRASGNGGGVGADRDGTFVKKGGVIDNTNSANSGKVAAVGPKIRDAAAGADVNMGSNQSGTAGGWK